MFAKVYRLKRRQVLPTSREACWEFFSTPKNLPRITPPWLGFEIGTLPDEVTRAGQIFQYRVRPMLGLRLTWVTEITHLVPLEMFVDEQRFGPYRFWHHQHLFRDVPGGVENIDIVHYALPLGWLGRALNYFSVSRKLEDIFDYRHRALTEIFGAAPGTMPREQPALESVAISLRR